ncbi:MAG TPA: DegT/DnrJ/EryC1/StrS family aminotransferase [Terriglobales bacterium]|nr:DegT/DnrJ/EryC1/StrS family aminotransferase [Terriglobales bacterium]
MIPISRPTFGPDEEQAVVDVMRSGQFAQGERVLAFERAFAAATGARSAVATSSGTTALFLALLAHGVGPGDEVITSTLTFIATANAICQTGATPVFADVDDTLNMSVETVAPLIGPHTRVVVPVHLHGNPCDVAGLGELASRHGLAMVQDACQAVGADVAGRPLGAFGTAVYSFYATKNLTTGEGGMVTTNDPVVAALCAALRHQSHSCREYVHDRIGYNFRMTELQAAIGLVQLGKLQAITSRRRRVAFHYDGIVPQGRFARPGTRAGAGHVFHQYTLRLPVGCAPERDQVREALAGAGIATGVYYPVPVHRQPAYLRYAGSCCANAERASEDMLSIPVHHALTDAEVEAVARALAAL